MKVMSRARFAVQVLVVSTLVALVSWPELRANQYLASSPALASGPSSPDDPRLPGRSDRRQSEIGFGTASYVSGPTAPGMPGLDEKLAENVYENRRSPLPDELL